MPALLELLEPRRLLAAIPPSAPQTFGGRVSASFVNAQPADTAVTTGQGTSDFTFGSGDPTVFGFQGRPFYNKMPGEIFWLGTLNYRNGATDGGTEATSVTLRITITMSQPAFSQPIAFDFPLGLISTPNDPNPLEPDYVQLLPPTGLTRTFTADDGGTYTLDILGFSHSSGAGYNQLNNFYIEEGGSATARLVGSIVPKPRIILIAPKRNATRAYISEDATMPALAVQVLGIPEDQQSSIDIHWRLTLHTRAKDSPFGQSVDGIDFVVRRKGTIYKPDFGSTVAGGKLSLSATFDLNGQHYALTATGLQILAHPPGEAAVTQYINNLPSPSNWPAHSGYDYHQILRKIAHEQSGYHTFASDGQPLWQSTGGVGLFGLLTAPAPADAWNWKANITDTAVLFNQKVSEALAWPAQQLATASAAIAQRKLDDHATNLTVAPFSHAMLVREAIELFASGHKYELIDPTQGGPYAFQVLYEGGGHSIGTVLWRDIGAHDDNPFCDHVLAQPA